MSLEGILARIVSREPERRATGLRARMELKPPDRAVLDAMLTAQVGTAEAGEILKQTPPPPPPPPAVLSPGTPERAEPPPKTAYPLVVGYYTEGTPYEQEAKSFRLSVEALGLEHDIRGVPNLGTWQKNTQYKAVFLRDRLKMHPNRDLLYVDVDAVMIHPPDMVVGLDCDLAAYCDRGNIHSGCLHSGTLYLANTPKCRAVVDAWVAMNEKYPEKLANGAEAWDQRTLQAVIAETPGVRFVNLPPEYCWIAGMTAKDHPGLNPVIVHTRGAYRLKAEVNALPGDVVPWVVFPTIGGDRARKTVQAWHDWGYKVAVLIEQPRATAAEAKAIGADKTLRPKRWEGFPKAANALCRAVPGKIVIVAGDDIEPHPQESGPVLARRFMDRFPDGFGVMQPTGDMWGGFKTACISPWIGREFIKRAYGGQGPYHEGYYHYFSDQELQEAAVKFSCFEQAADVYQFHRHWQREGLPRPAHLIAANDHWRADHDMFVERQAAGFPGCEAKP